MKARFALFFGLLVLMIAYGTGSGAQTRIADGPTVDEEARRLHLPILLSLPDSMGGQAFRLRRVLRPEPATRNTGAGTQHKAQALYVGGKKSVSVFVSDVARNADARLAPPSEKDGWKPLKLGDGRIAFMHTTAGVPYSAVVWVGAGHRYTAIARLPLSRLAPLARALARSSALAVASLPSP